MNLRHFRVSLTVFVFALPVLVVGLVLLALSWWLRPVGDAEEDMARGDVQAALAQYQASRTRLDRTATLRRVFPKIYDLVTANELSLLYSLQRYDEIIEKTNEDSASVAPFWAGCAMFGKGLLEDKPDARMDWISQSHQQFRRALDITPGDWDSKFNYELTARMIGRLKKQPETPKQELMKLLRDSQRTQSQPVRKVG